MEKDSEDDLDSSLIVDRQRIERERVTVPMGFQGAAVRRQQCPSPPRYLRKDTHKVGRPWCPKEETRGGRWYLGGSIRIIKIDALFWEYILFKNRTQRSHPIASKIT